MKDDPIIIPILRVRHEIFYRLWRVLSKQLEVYIPLGRVDDRRPARYSGLHRFCSYGDGLFFSSGLFVENVSVAAFGVFGFGTGEDVEALFLEGGAEEGGVAAVVLLQEGVRGCDHSLQETCD